MYYLVVDDWGIETINKAQYIWKKISEANNKSGMTSKYLNNIFMEMYNTMIYRIYISFYVIKLNTKLAKVFCYK